LHAAYLYEEGVTELCQCRPAHACAWRLRVNNDQGPPLTQPPAATATPAAEAALSQHRQKSTTTLYADDLWLVDTDHLIRYHEGAQACRFHKNPNPVPFLDPDILIKPKETQLVNHGQTNMPRMLTCCDVVKPH
jgi:hypothetical protein